jgi:hypothetical protein
VPVSRREPRQATPKRDPSSSANAAIPIGRLGANPRSRSVSMASSAETMPSGPSYPPPCGTESKWLPVTTACPDDGSPHHAHRLPLPSGSTVSSRSSASSVNHSRHASSASPNA